MRNTDQLHESVRRSDLPAVAVFVERVALHRFAACGELALGTRPRQRANRVAPAQQHGDQRPADVAGTARDEHVCHYSLISF